MGELRLLKIIERVKQVAEFLETLEVYIRQLHELMQRTDKSIRGAYYTIQKISQI